MLSARETAVVQGRTVTEADLDGIRELLGAHPDWSRRRLSQVLAREWNVSVKQGAWRPATTNGRTKTCLPSSEPVSRKPRNIIANDRA